MSSSKVQAIEETRNKLRELLKNNETNEIKKLVQDGTININLTDIAQKDLISLPIEFKNLEITKFFSERIQAIKLSSFVEASEEALPFLAAAAARLRTVQEIAKHTVSSRLSTTAQRKILLSLKNVDYTKIFVTTLKPTLLEFMLSESRVSPESEEAQKSLQDAVRIAKLDTIKTLTKHKVPVSLEMLTTSIKNKSKAVFDILKGVSSAEVLSDGLLFAIKNKHYDYAVDLSVTKSVPVNQEHVLALHYTAPETQDTPQIVKSLFTILGSSTEGAQKLTTLDTMFKTLVCNGIEVSPIKEQDLLLKLGKKLFCDKDNAFTANHAPVVCTKEIVTSTSSVEASTQTHHKTVNIEAYNYCVTVNAMVGITDHSNCDSVQ